MTSVADRATAFKHAVSGSNINKIVCKASSHDLAGPKKKHVDFLITLTNNPQVSMPTLVDMLGERLTNSSWIVVMKALITTHNLLTLGNEKYLQCLATRTNPFELEGFHDRSSVLASDMTKYVHKYSRYLGAYCSGYRATVLDIYRMPRGDKSPLRAMDHAKLLKASTVLQGQLDLLLDLDITQGELTNGVINTAFLMLYKDLIKLYAVYNDALLNVLEHFFEMKKAQCKEAVEIYRKFLTRQENVQNFLKLAEEIGVDQKSHLNLRQVPADLLQALEEHIGEMDTIRKAANNQKPSPQIKAASEKLSGMKDQRPSSGSNTPTFRSITPNKMPQGNEELLEAQKKRFEELKKRASDKNFGGGSPVPQDPPPAASKGRSKSPEGDEFDKMAATRSTPQLQPASNNKSGGLDELFGLDFGATGTSGSASMSMGGSTATAGGNTFNPFQSQPQNNPWGGGGGYQEVSLFPQSGGNPLDSSFGSPAPTSMGNSLGDVLQPVATGPLAAPVSQPQPKRLTTDVDSSLAQAAANLSIELSGGGGGGGGAGGGGGVFGVPPSSKPSLQWSGPTPQQSTLTGGPMYQRPQIMQPTTLPPGQSAAMFGGGGFYQPQGPYGMQPSGFQQQGGWPQTGGPMMGAAPMYNQGSYNYSTPQRQQPFF